MANINPNKGDRTERKQERKAKMAFIQDEAALEAVQLYFVGIGGLAFLTYKMYDVLVANTVRDIATRL
jgi:hypothetical protein